MTDRVRYIAANIGAPALTCLIVFVVWYFSVFKPGCSGAHCLGIGPTLIIYLIVLLSYMGMFLWTISDRKLYVVKSGRISFLRLSRGPVLVFLIWCFAWGVAAALIKNPRIIEEGNRLLAYFSGVLFFFSFVLFIGIFQLLWLLVLGRRNQVYLEDNE